MRLPTSHLYTFIDGPREFALYFLEAQRLIEDLALLHPIRRNGFAYFREVVLSIQPMIAFLKHGEQLGFYIDSVEPSFRLKIETGHHGETRCVLLPEQFHDFPAAMRGIVRLLKLFPNNKAPYESVLHVDGKPLRDIVNRVLRESYQVHSAVIVSGHSDQSVMLHQLPPLPDEYEYSAEALQNRRRQLETEVRKTLARALHRPEEIEQAFGALGFRLLAGRDVRFQCSCSRERMIRALGLLGERDRNDLFDPGETTLEIKCEYCKTAHRISRGEIEGPAPLLH